MFCKSPAPHPPLNCSAIDAHDTQQRDVPIQCRPNPAQSTMIPVSCQSLVSIWLCSLTVCSRGIVSNSVSRGRQPQNWTRTADTNSMVLNQSKMRGLVFPLVVPCNRAHFDEPEIQPHCGNPPSQPAPKPPIGKGLTENGGFQEYTPLQTQIPVSWCQTRFAMPRQYCVRL
jgi:hypothetical protein